jgi:hypothetical protein
MDPTNDNRPRAEASRLLPVLGRVGRDGRVTFRPGPPLEPDPLPRFPNDPREV